MTVTPADSARPVPRVPAVSWLVPLAAVAGAVGGSLIWYRPIGYNRTGHGVLGVEAHSWQGGAVGALAPLLLLIAGVLVLRRLVSKKPAKPGRNPVRRTGVVVVVLAVVAVAMMGLSRALILDATVSVNGKSYTLEQLARALNASSYTRGTQIGFWVTAVAAALALVGGIAMIVRGRATAAVPAPSHHEPVAPAESTENALI